MTTYTIRLDASAGDVQAQIEALRGIGAVDLLFTIEASNRATAIVETIDVVNEFDATYHGTWPSAEKEEYIRNSMKAVRNPLAA